MNLKISAIIIAAVASVAITARADLRLPSNMTATDRDDCLRVLGLGSSTKLLTNPYPLGGYSGFEIGVSYENLPTQDLSQFGSKNQNEPDQVAFENLSIGKGLYNNLDGFLEFTPWSGATGIAEYGALIRWGFYEAKFFPLSYAALFHANIANFHSDLSTQSTGVDLLAAINANEFSLYFGVGRGSVVGQFSSSVTDTGQSETDNATETHTFVGASLQMGQMFAAAEIDRYTVPVYSLKLGVRY